MIRKYFLAFDVANTGKITRDQFVDTAKVVAAEFFIDYDSRGKRGDLDVRLIDQPNRPVVDYVS